MMGAVYYYPYEVVKEKGVRWVGYLKASIREPHKRDYTCSMCRKDWPDVCTCPTTEEEWKNLADEITAKHKEDSDFWKAYYDRFGLGYPDSHARSFYGLSTDEKYEKLAA